MYSCFIRGRFSVVAITDESGTLISQQRYLPFGGVRTNIANGPIVQTDYGYTGQRNLDDDIGLMDYKARFYSPVLNRFIQPDTIVPEMYNPQMFNRFSYVGNNPINFNDPTGHLLCDADGYCDQQSSINQRNSNGRCIGKCPSPKPPKPEKEENNPQPIRPIICNDGGSCYTNGQEIPSTIPSLPHFQDYAHDDWEMPSLSAEVNWYYQMISHPDFSLYASAFQIVLGLIINAGMAMTVAGQPYGIPIFAISYVAYQVISAVSIHSTIYQYNNDLNGTNSTDVWVTIGTSVVGIYPPASEGASLAGFIYDIARESGWQPPIISFPIP